MTIYIVRHCETIGNKLKIHGGTSDVLLTIKGINQAISIGNRLADENEDFSKYLFISSYLSRARHTIQIIMETLGIINKPITIEPLIVSKFKGIFENVSKEEIKKNFPEEMEKKKLDHWNWCPPGGGESHSSEYDRTLKFLEKYKDTENIVICSHSGVCSILKEILNGKTKEEIKDIRINLKYNQNYFYSYSKEKGLNKL